MQIPVGVQKGDAAPMQSAERLIIGFIVVTASLCVGLIALYLCMFDVRGLLQ